MTSRAFYSDPSAARAVLDAIGGPVERPRRLSQPDAPNDAPPERAKYRGRCGNLEHPPTWIKVGERRIKADHCGRTACNRADDCPCHCAECLGAERAGCGNEVCEESRFLRLCARCREKYRAMMPTDREHVAALDARRPMPGLCEAHGQRFGECGSCVR